MDPLSQKPSGACRCPLRSLPLSPSAPQVWISGITGGPGAAALPYPPARPCFPGTRKREAGGKDRAAGALRPRGCRLRRERTLAPGLQEDAPPTAPAQDQTAPGTRGPPAEAPPLQPDSAPRARPSPRDVDSEAIRAPPSGSGELSGRWCGYRGRWGETEGKSDYLKMAPLGETAS